jgi:ankyrin repeat/IBR domain-containing protein 1
VKYVSYAVTVVVCVECHTMGSSSSKFRKHIQSGDEYAALHLYSSSSDLRKALDPNVSYGDSYNHDTPMHVVARHAMKSLLRLSYFHFSC